MRALLRTLHVTGLLFPVCDLEGNEWEEHPQFCLTGEGNSVATKTQQPSAQLPEWHNTLVTNRVMDSGIHRISLLYTLPPNPEMYGRTPVDVHTYLRPGMFGVTLDGVASGERARRAPAWLISAFSGQRYYGMGAAPTTDEMHPRWGEWTDESAVGKIKEGQVLSMELNMDVGTLKFWVDGHLHGPGFTGIRPGDFGGRLRWAACVTKVGMSVRIVPTPALDGV